MPGKCPYCGSLLTNIQGYEACMKCEYVEGGYGEFDGGIVVP